MSKTWFFSIAHDYNMQKGSYNYILGVIEDKSTENLKLEKIKLPQNTWVVFESKLEKGDIVASFLPKLYHQIYTQWFPNSDYEICDKYSFEIWPETLNDKGEYTFETWMPVRKLK